MIREIFTCQEVGLFATIAVMLKARAIIIFTGILWLSMGFFLLHKGLKLAILGSFEPDRMFTWLGSAQQSGPLLVVVGLIAGHLKGKHVLSKTAARLIQRIEALPRPISLKKVYPPSFGILVASMMALGMLLNHLPIASDLRGLIDVAIGAALLNGSLFYFKRPKTVSLS